MNISADFRAKCPNIRLGIIRASVQIETERADLWAHITAKMETLAALSTTDLAAMPTIAATRKAYKALGKDPSRYRPSAEALLRRIVQGKGLYRINNVVDLLNFVSISTGYSIGGYDAAKIVGATELGIGSSEPYEGIGRGTLNIEGLPAFRDELGAFGTPTSDSVRTSVTAATTDFLMVLLDFEGLPALHEAMSLALDLLQRFGNAEKVEHYFVA